MRRCPNCSNENPDQMAFCLNCGRELPVEWNQFDKTTDSLHAGPATIGTPSVETRFYRQPAETGFGTQAQPKRSSRPVVLAVIALLVGGIGVVTALGLAGWYFYKRTPSPVGLVPPSENTNTVNANASPKPSFTPPTEPTKTGTFTVAANSGWQLSEIDTVPREEFTTKVTGLIDLAGVKSRLTAKGTNDATAKSRRLFPDLPAGALLMRTRYADGKFSNVQPVTAGASGNWQNFEDERGRLEFCVNDNAPEQNGGQFVVTVKMTRVPKPKK